MKKLKILVIDHSPIHQESARQILTDHDLTVIGDYDEALELLLIKCGDRSEIEQILQKNGLPKKHDGLEGDARQKWFEMYDEIKEQTKRPYWDVVLCELIMPAGSDAQGDKGYRYVREDMPVGWSLGLLSAQRGAKYVAVVTSINHHDHPASAMLDRIKSSSYLKRIFNINESKVIFGHTSSIGVEGTECEHCKGTKYTDEFCGWCGGDGINNSEPCSSCSGTGKSKCYKCDNGKIKGKDWGEILDLLINK